nr:CAP domain-containing protein [Acidimicrobiia bacterium]
MATVHTQKMLGSGGGIFHNLDLLTQPLRNVLGAVAVGENVGWSTHLEDLHPRLMASPGHRAALLDPRFTVAGFAVMQDTDGLYYVTQDFVQPSGATPPPSPPAPSPPASSVPDDAAPAPASAPVRVTAPVSAEETAAQTVAGTRRRVPMPRCPPPSSPIDECLPAPKWPWARLPASSRAIWRRRRPGGAPAR